MSQVIEFNKIKKTSNEKRMNNSRKHFENLLSHIKYENLHDKIEKAMLDGQTSIFIEASLDSVFITAPQYDQQKSIMEMIRDRLDNKFHVGYITMGNGIVIIISWPNDSCSIL